MLQLNKFRNVAVPAAKQATSTCWRHFANASDHSFDHYEDAAGVQNAEDVIESTLRVDLLAQEAATALAAGRSYASGHRRPDLASFFEDEKEHLQRIKDAVPHYNVRPSLLGPLTKAAFGALGLVSAVAPPKLSSAMAAGIQDALSDTFNEQLRDMREAGIADSAKDVRMLVRELRDQERAPEGSPKVPDILSLRQPQELTPAEGLAAVVKAGTRLLLNASKRI